MTVPLIALNQINAARCDWLVPGLLKEKVMLLAKSLPQKLRHKLGPLPEFAAEFVAAVAASDTPLVQAIARHARASAIWPFRSTVSGRRPCPRTCR